MAPMPCRLLSLAPYRVLPATTGGHWGIVSMHDAIGRLCEDHLLCTADNGPADAYSFMPHRIFPAKPRRYLPRAGFEAALGIARKYDATHIFCDHPYMAPLARALSRRLRVPWALRSHNIEAERFRLLGKRWWQAMSAFEGWAMRAADAIFFITPEDCSRAVGDYRLDTARCHLAPYGTTLQAAPGGHSGAKAALAESMKLDAGIPWLYFLGVQDYAPNAEATGHILREVLPRLQASAVPCGIIIAGKGLPQAAQDALAATGGAIRYAGFVDDLDQFLKACDVMLNPLTSGGGIKTKAIEALGYNKLVVSTVNGAAGILPEVCGDNLIVAGDGDWNAFAEGIGTALTRSAAIPQAFYDRYNWNAIAEHVTTVLCNLKYGR